MQIKPWMLLTLVVALSACGDINDIMAAQERGCAARGGVLTASGCQGAGISQSLPGRIGNAPTTDRYGQANYNERGEYIGGRGTGLLVDRPLSEPDAPTRIPSNVVCTTNAAGNAQVCNSP